ARLVGGALPGRAGPPLLAAPPQGQRDRRRHLPRGVASSARSARPAGGAAQSGRATDVQKKTFDFPAASLVTFFLSARDRMEVADSLYHAFKAMPAPECQALGALLNVHVDARLDAGTMIRLVRLLDHEGPMSPEEMEDLAAISKTHLVDAAFSGLRAHA